MAVLVALAALVAYSLLHHSSPRQETKQQAAMLATDQKNVCHDLGNVGTYAQWDSEPKSIAAPSSRFLTVANAAATDRSTVENTVNLPVTPFWTALALLLGDYNAGGNRPPYDDWLDLHELQAACGRPA